MAQRNLLAFLLLLTPSGMTQDNGHGDYRKCASCVKALDKAMAYVKKHYAAERFHDGLLPRILGGFAFMMHGEFAADLEECVKYARRQLESGPDMAMGNWSLALSLFFLAEYSLKFGRDPAIEAALQKGVKRAEAAQEKNGGWGHELGYAARTGYLSRNGSTDLSIITAIMYAAFVEVKALGTDPGPVMDRARRNLESLFEGNGFNYGSDNRVLDRANSRAAYVLLGLIAVDQTNDPLFDKIVRGIGERFRSIEQGHACAPLHYFSIGAAMHRLGPDQYLKCSRLWVHALISTQDAEGSVHMFNDIFSESSRPKAKGDINSTAVFACLILMQRDGVFRPKIKPKNR